MQKLNFHYIKSPSHQELAVDGAVGGVTATGRKIAVSVYTERNAIPQLVVHELQENKLGAELTEDREGKEGVVRIVQATLHMGLDQAQSLHKWLGERISELQEIKEP